MNGKAFVSIESPGNIDKLLDYIGDELLKAVHWHCDIRAHIVERPPVDGFADWADTGHRTITIIITPKPKAEK